MWRTTGGSTGRGLRVGSNDWVVIADDHVRYDAGSLTEVIALLAYADIVQTQNFFKPSPWHA